ncbi:MAG: NADH-quinone oxidoreductase subunit NuoF [Candidatus Hatepunaea meridiana]|nr:NADH-quinone oxidoreductase subunit NuoF [Candidatus Hatepunaea meridiana]
MSDTITTSSLAGVAEKLKPRYETSKAAMMPLLYEVQARDGYISPEAETEIAELLGVSPTEVHESVSFYPLLFEKPVGKYHIQFCHNISCSLVGAEPLIELLRKELGVGPGEVTEDGLFSYQRAECLGCCADAPVMLVNEELFGKLTEEKIRNIIEQLRAGKKPKNDTPLTETDEIEDPVLSVNFMVPNGANIKVAEQRGAYTALRKALKEMEPQKIIEEVKSAGLRGMGGAGFPAGLKWSFVPKDPTLTKYLCVNCDESEPGTCKDREIMRRDPHRLIEGAIIACRAFGAEKAYVYIRREFYHEKKVFDKAIEEARKAGYIGDNILDSGFSIDFVTHPGAGAYICGEETGLINSIEGKKGWPRIKPPFPALQGIFDKPTVVNNVETLSNIPYIINNGIDAYRRRGTEKSPGTKLFGVSGQVKRPGIFELPMGFSLRELIYGICGGMREGHLLKAVIPGGCSVPVLTADEIDVALDFESLEEGGTSLGSGGIIVMDDSVSMPWALEILERFYAHESCGQCTPCREGVMWMYKILQRMNNGRGRKGDIELLIDIANNIEGQTVCPLGAAAAWPVQAMLKKFRGEFEELIQ